MGSRLNGSNHSSWFDACTFTACRDTHLIIDSHGFASDGNQALLFRACDIEFGAGAGVDAAKGASATFDTCYIGEGLETDVIRNRGNVVVRDFFMQFGYRANSVAIRPLAGLVVIERGVVAGQTFGYSANLIDLSPSEVAAGADGRAKFVNINGNFHGRW